LVRVSWRRAGSLRTSTEWSRRVEIVVVIDVVVDAVVSRHVGAWLVVFAVTG